MKTRYAVVGAISLCLLMINTPTMAASPYVPGDSPSPPALSPYPRPSFSSPNDWTGNINLFGGGKFLNSNDWSPADQQLEYGVELDARRRFWPVNLALDILYGEASDNSGGYNFKSKIYEFDVGIRKVFDQFPAPLHPYVGGGIAVTQAEAVVSGFGSDSGTGPGVWIQGGIYMTFGDHFNLGADFRASSTWVDIAGTSVDGGGVHIGLITGYHW
jgi:Outer membrane protein beta-barrel domain